nr:3864_t:CDS:2 [Entrophospora candida]
MSSQKREAKTSSKNLPSLKKCKCSSLKHQHITSKNCPIQKVSRAKIYPTFNSTNTLTLTRTIKCALNSMLIDNSIKPALEDALTHINTITFEGAKLLELYLLDKLDRETSEHAMVSTCGIGQIISLSANQYLTNRTCVNINNVGENVKNIDDASQQCLNYILELYNEVRNFVGDLDLSEDAMGLRIFDIIPQFSFHTRYMSLDTNALYKVLKSIVIHPLERGINETQFGDNANYYWNQDGFIEDNCGITNIFGKKDEWS